MRFALPHFALDGGKQACAIVLLCAGPSACGGLIAPADGGAVLGDAALVDAGDATTVVDGSAEAVPAPPCDYDASTSDDAALCTPPADDVLYPNPPVINVAAGSWGVATFVAAGPWASDPNLFVHYESSTLPLTNSPYVSTFGTPQSLSFLVSDPAAGQEGTLTVSAHAGNIERAAQVTVKITSCVPQPGGYCFDAGCGFEGDGCGGLQSCGTCGGSTPYCYVYSCVADPVTPCRAGYGYDIEDGRPTDCILCAETKSCRKCNGGYCDSLNSVCYCHYPQ